ncbi:recombinase family protein [Anaerobacillus sp. HL2]|nr:recombinase family protein [Anaerobacillus sp. HL2]
MIRHATDKKIDIILCKSVSRFGRNVLGLINTIRQLRELGVRIIFDKKIDTDDMAKRVYFDNAFCYGAGRKQKYFRKHNLSHYEAV